LNLIFSLLIYYLNSFENYLSLRRKSDFSFDQNFLVGAMLFATLFPGLKTGAPNLSSLRDFILFRLKTGTPGVFIFQNPAIHLAPV